MTRSYPHHQHHRLTPFPVRNAIEEEILIDGVGREEMASGWGVTGNEGRCCDFSDCVSRCREPNRCALLLDDYLECLHHALQVIPLTPYSGLQGLLINADFDWAISPSCILHLLGHDH
ncbi:NADH dehydrogenase ubiquinone iron-sulfur protein [Musa troglodytarum]|uniref:NADH dehydrogenase [ubiquinone] iron-sulfur protein 5 n=1 Tax=Musa troglodytarum TaxID=320322 RepID=A0A9E7EMQ1_9LILI|nr:NADH dehydrogenase ubiquinone iron-sulfur protein [Musa troglodytarum]